MSETRPVLCGKCHVTVERGFERDGETWARCTVCWREDRMEDIMREAAEYHADKAIRGVFSGFKSGSVNVKSLPQREYRWITGD